MKRLLALLTATIVMAVTFWVSPIAAENALAAPAAPTGFLASAYSASQINLSWNAVSGATSYQVYRSTGASTTFTRIAIVTARSYQNTGLQAATRYNYKVRAVVSGVLGSFTAVKTAYTKPATPTGLTATAISTSQINLKWNAVTGATSYQVYRSYGASTSYTRIAIVTAPAYSNTGLAAGARYNYKVRAVKSGNIGDFTAAKTAYTKPTIPTGLAAKTISASQIDLSWTAVTGATSYQVYRSTGSSTSYTRIAIVTAPAYSNRSLAAGTRYNYKVCAVKSGSIGGFTAVKTAYTKPATPTGLAAAAQSSSSIKLTWAAVAGAAKYIVYRSASATGTFAKVGEATVATYTNTGLAANTTYYYKVSAANAGGEGALSAAASAKTLAAALPAPTGLKATTASTSQINLAWNAVSGATQYQVYRSVGASTAYSLIRTQSTTSFNNIGLTPGVKYNYRVKALAGSASSAYSATASAYTKPLAPINVAATRASDTKIHLTWSKPSECTGYKVYVSVNGGGYTYLATVTEPTRQYDHAGLAAGTYQYRITAVAGTIESAPTNTVALVMPDPRLPAPGNFSASTYNYQSVQLTYDVVQNAAKYRIYYSEIASSNINDYDYFDWASKDCRVIGLDAATTYYFRVAAVDAQGQVGIPTGFVSATTSASPGNPPQPFFYLYNIEVVGSLYRMNFVRSTSPIYPTVYEPTFNFYTGTSSSNMTLDSTCDLSQYFYMDVTPGQALWYGFTANYGPYASTMQKLNLAALGKPTGVTANGHLTGGILYMSWNTVYAASRYNIYRCTAAPDPTKTWAEFKASATANGHLSFLGYTGSTSASISGMPNYSNYYYIIVPANSSGVEGAFYNYAIGSIFY